MHPIDIRNTNWQELQATLAGRMQEVWLAWQQHGPCTTRQLAQSAGIDILNVRPRTTDLCHLGLIEITGLTVGEGIYRARTQPEWTTWHTEQTRPEVDHQQLLI